MNKKIQVTIKGDSPLLMHAFPLLPIEALEKKKPEDQAELAAYRDPDTQMLYIPGQAVQRAMISAAKFSKGKGRASLQLVAAACILITPERISLGRKDYKIDSRPVVVPATRGRVMRHRPRIDDWEATFEIEYDPDLLTEKQVRVIVNDAGSRVGLLDFRPEKKGPFGRFSVIKWDSD
jgi:hypothetical protein